MIETLLKILELKDEKRTGWELRNIEGPESVADHSWSTAFLCLIYGEKEDIDVDHAIKLALVHDIGEASTGDIAYRAIDAEQEVTEKEKQELEEQAVTKFSNSINGDIKALWQEYENRETKESRFIKDMDIIDMCLQALKYEKQGRYDKDEENENFQEYDDLDEFFATAEPRLNTDTGKQLFKEIKTRYEDAKKE